MKGRILDIKQDGKVFRGCVLEMSHGKEPLRVLDLDTGESRICHREEVEKVIICDIFEYDSHEIIKSSLNEAWF